MRGHPPASSASPEGREVRALPGDALMLEQSRKRLIRAVTGATVRIITARKTM
jgi:hypothetical protein